MTRVTDASYVTRRELDLMKASADAEHAEFARQLLALDTGGSRGVIGLQVQMTDQTRELAKLQVSVDELRKDVDRRFDAHLVTHGDEARARVSSRRWLAGIILAAIAAVDGPVVTLLLAHH